MSSTCTYIKFVRIDDDDEIEILQLENQGCAMGWCVAGAWLGKAHHFDKKKSNNQTNYSQLSIFISLLASQFNHKQTTLTNIYIKNVTITNDAYSIDLSNTGLHKKHLTSHTQIAAFQTVITGFQTAISGCRMANFFAWTTLFFIQTGLPTRQQIIPY
ncbi:unnamed protein product [Ambrosiozyma monospora]|uniref:Unnamed protein product n=1 Tax=Ambrosiozyma monospora TaxID=43982 RepID=A0ACB5T2R8_AMBMO|nr:unnamed protein product [Ambrosiozyma monospora]